MSDSSILGGTGAPHRAQGRSADVLGPSDSSDSGSDVQGGRAMATEPDNAGEWGGVISDGRADTDAAGTGERAGAGGEGAVDGADILPDRIVSIAGDETELADEVQDLEAAEDESEEASEGEPLESDEPAVRDV